LQNRTKHLNRKNTQTVQTSAKHADVSEYPISRLRL